MFNDTGSSSGVDEIRFTSTRASTLTLSSVSGIEKVVIGTGTGAAAVTTGRAAVNVDASAIGEGLTIIGNAGANILTGGSGADTLHGGAGNDTLTGNGGADLLVGGLGNDILTGGDNADQFVFNATPSTSNLDTITDFEVGMDKVQLSKAIFAALGDTATLTDAEFWAGDGVTSAHDSSDRILYNASTGALYYDADGTGSGAAVQTALLGTTSHPTNLTFSDFLIT